MLPIYEQEKKKGRGLDVKQFLARFDEICREHVAAGTARAFAFIFYDRDDHDIRKLLKDNYVFSQLDQLSGDDLTVFYLHAPRRQTLDRFNQEFLDRLGVQGPVYLPCVVFFKFKDETIGDVEVAELNYANLMNGLHELYRKIEAYKATNGAQRPSRFVRLLKGGAVFLTRQAIDVAFEHLLSGLF